jgi:hypothetical protein
VDGRVFGGGILGIFTVGEGIWVGFFAVLSGSHASVENRSRFSIRFSLRIGGENCHENLFGSSHWK